MNEDNRNRKWLQERIDKGQTMYPDVFAPLGGDICTGGPASQSCWEQERDDFTDAMTAVLAKHDVHATGGCMGVELACGPIDAPEYLCAGSTTMDWFPRTTMVKREI
jgi:hypothetical protein